MWAVVNQYDKTKEDWAYLLKTISHALKESDPRFFNDLNAKIREMKQSSWYLLRFSAQNCYNILKLQSLGCHISEKWTG